MSSHYSVRSLIAAALAIGAASLYPVRHAGAEVTDLASAPLAEAPSNSVLPNLMYILDDSGSMAWNYMPDNVFRTSSGSIYYNCKKCTSSSCIGPGGSSSGSGWQCGNDQADPDTASTNAPTTYGEAPFYASGYNKLWYNPDITYAPGVDSTGTVLGTISPTNASNDAYLTISAANGDGGVSITVVGSTNLVSGFKEVVYCNITNPTAANLTDPTKCRKNGIHNVGATYGGGNNYFLYYTSASTNIGFPTTGYYNKVLVQNSNAHYYNIAPNEYCSNAILSTCALATAAGASPGSPYTIAAPLRFCKTAAAATSTLVQSGTSGSPATPICQNLFNATLGYIYPRFGRFSRVDIVPATATYPKSATSVRTDCGSGTTCTYAQEIQNYANWWSYYSTRLGLMKSATGRAFLPIDSRFRIGFITINPNTPVTTDKFLGVSAFNSTQKDAWYTLLYGQVTNGSTPNRTALYRVGQYYAGATTGINAGMAPPDPIQYSCQQNFALLTTDGYWNDSFSSIGNVDNSNTGYFTRGIGAYDGGLSGASSTLADVAAYFYGTDLRTSGSVSANNVPTSLIDTNPTQHMVTFTLGLGLTGYMTYRPDYQTATSGDFANIKAGTNNACSWTTGICNWPVPSANDPSTLDDLWHAAVNGRGKYFSTGDPNSLTAGLQEALAALQVQTAAASASATSSPNITQTSNYIFSSTFRTVDWDGEVVAQQIDTVSGNVLPAIVWSAQGQLDAKTTATSDARTIFTINESGPGKRKSFDYTVMSNAPAGGIAAEQPYFDNKCTLLSQCALLDASQQTSANSGLRLVQYLRGWRQDEAFVAPETTPAFRARAHVLGDPVDSTPSYMQAPQYNFADAVTPTYATFKTNNTSRQGTLFIASNEGMLHAFNGNTGSEIWAYVPRIVMPKLYLLATANWSTVHQYNVDGSPQLMDAFIGGSWRTVLVAGLNGGGRGYYALDVTDPLNPTVLWEICSDSTLCAINDTDIGFTFGNAVITKRASDGKWVAIFTSGMNNILPGTGKGFLYVADLATGAILQKIPTGVGSTATPSGFNHISAYADNFDVDNTAKFVYGGDLYGNVWKFDMTVATPAVTQLATLKDGTGKPQSITTRPELAVINGFPVVYVGTGRYLGLSDLVDPATLVPAEQWAYQQSLYAIKDKGVSYGNFRTGNVVIQTIIQSSAVLRTSTNLPVDWATKDGWVTDFNPGGNSPGERVNIDPQLVQGTLIVVSNVPNNSACTVGGDSWIYQFDYKTGAYIQSAALNQVAQKFTGQITVGLVVVRLPSGVFKGISTGATGTKTPFAVNIGGAGGNARRVSWRELVQQ